MYDAVINYEHHHLSIPLNAVSLSLVESQAQGDAKGEAHIFYEGAPCRIYSPWAKVLCLKMTKIKTMSIVIGMLHLEQESFHHS